MLVLPVLDLLAGQVVHGIAGERASYRPIRSQLTSATDPLSLARAFREHLGLSTLYLADLDAIAGRPAAFDVFRSLRDDGFQLWLDAGLRDVRLAAQLEAIGIEKIIAGLESFPRRDFARQLCEAIDPSRIVVSLDMRDGKPLTEISEWQAQSPEAIALEIAGDGCTQFLLLDLVEVGMNRGPATAALCARLRATHGAKIRLATGGGIRGVGDIALLREAGADAVLVASALHDLRITRRDLACLA